jgi:hypothetical protein
MMKWAKQKKGLLAHQRRNSLKQRYTSIGRIPRLALHIKVLIQSDGGNAGYTVPEAAPTKPGADLSQQKKQTVVIHKRG